MQIFDATSFQFPYRHLKFPGQHSEEIILFICREAKIMVYLRSLVVLTGTLILLLMYLGLRPVVTDSSPTIQTYYHLIFLGLILAYTATGLYWVHILWKKSVFIITTRRLTKFIHTTPWNRYQLSLGLDKIVDTGSYQKGFIQAIFKLGYLVARSSAGNIKNFKILNISYAEDLQNYINKLLFTFNKETAKLDTFRPFIPHLKGDARAQFIHNNTPEYDKTSHTSEV
jgi:hypothetical protein